MPPENVMYFFHQWTAFSHWTLLAEGLYVRYWGGQKVSIIKNNEMCEEENEKFWPVASPAYLDRKYFCKSGQITCLQLHWRRIFTYLINQWWLWNTKQILNFCLRTKKLLVGWLLGNGNIAIIRQFVVVVKTVLWHWHCVGSFFDLYSAGYLKAFQTRRRIWVVGSRPIAV